MFTRYLGNAAGFGSQGLAGIGTGQQLLLGNNALIRDAINTEQFVLDRFNQREAAEQFQINQNNGLGALANRAQIFNNAPNAAVSNQALLDFAAAAQTLAPFAQAAEAGGATNAFNGFNQGVNGLLGTTGANFNGAGALTTNSLLGQSILGPQLFQQQIGQLGLANRAIGNRASTGGQPPGGGFFGGSFLPNGLQFGASNPLGYQDRFGVNSGTTGFRPLNALTSLGTGNATGQTRRI